MYMSRGHDSFEEPRQRTHLFTLRLWAETLGDGRSEWRGQLRHVVSGEVRYFRDWLTLVSLLGELLPDAPGQE